MRKQLDEVVLGHPQIKKINKNILFFQKGGKIFKSNKIFLIIRGITSQSPPPPLLFAKRKIFFGFFFLAETFFFL